LTARGRARAAAGKGRNGWRAAAPRDASSGARYVRGNRDRPV